MSIEERMSDTLLVDTEKFLRFCRNSNQFSLTDCLWMLNSRSDSKITDEDVRAGAACALMRDWTVGKNPGIVFGKVRELKKNGYDDPYLVLVQIRGLVTFRISECCRLKEFNGLVPELGRSVMLGFGSRQGEKEDGTVIKNVNQNLGQRSNVVVSVNTFNWTCNVLLG